MRVEKKEMTWCKLRETEGRGILRIASQECHQLCCSHEVAGLFVAEYAATVLSSLLFSRNIPFSLGFLSFHLLSLSLSLASTL